MGGGRRNSDGIHTSNFVLITLELENLHFRVRVDDEQENRINQFLDQEGAQENSLTLAIVGEVIPNQHTCFANHENYGST